MVLVVSVGDMDLHFDNCRILVLKDCYYVPKFRRNLISVSYLFEQDYSTTFNKNVIINKNNKQICKGSLINSLYFLYPKSFSLDDTKIIEPVHKWLRLSTNKNYLWHLRLGHINLDRIKRLVKHGPLNYLEVDDFHTCKSCLEGKMPKRPFLTKGERPT